MKVVPLGAGQDVGRSCVLVTLGGKTIMFDCGMHMGYNDERRFPNFNYITTSDDFTSRIDAVVITHFHLDHCGALPHFSEQRGYHGPIYMTPPTKAICPILLEDYRKITVERKGETGFFTSQHIKDCMKKVVPLHLHETVWVDDELELRAYYAGHVLGAAMIYARCGSESVVYTGDYNMTPDRHLGAAWIEKVRPDILITESTYGTTIRDSKRARERDFTEKVRSCVARGGKVLIPCFALGRAQELCILIESYWERLGLKVPVYFSAGLTEKANRYYKLFINWTNQKVKESFVDRNPFDFKYIKPWNRDYVDLPGPMVLFATPGMLHIGTSLEVFKKWAPDERNMLIMPGYCVAGTIGAKVLSGMKVVDIDQYSQVNVNIDVQNLSFSAHADAKGIMELIRQASPRNVVLVHGEKSRMSYLKSKIMGEFGCPCYDPANGELLEIETEQDVRALMSDQLFQRAWSGEQQRQERLEKDNQIKPPSPITQMPVRGVLLLGDGGKRLTRLLDPSEFDLDQVPVAEPRAENFKTDDQQPTTSGDTRSSDEPDEKLETVVFSTRKIFDDVAVAQRMGLDDNADTIQAVLDAVYELFSIDSAQQVHQHKNVDGFGSVSVGDSVKVSTSPVSDFDELPSLSVSWAWEEEELATQTLAILNRVLG
ncbi:Metallo-hydrolase/oxidoreductase [Coemansia reversa NRRL 1564]|uniref:Metallo-hydrolase/oxidoreductase n=1 Tax=Coemansia reversa (strain ATCC 12441 / NRRL 1564) TaxID=763665 RepID=A0A2G5BGY1_COERN|nr:Metallo-hydrolase/oxidoreductase [Coemansia reversa NRRL 1564]|eukprot:PIA18263.1 Metallo-hydrolase/oxidoreductase [Coemansia reversa NRRL 1564]